MPSTKRNQSRPIGKHQAGALKSREQAANKPTVSIVGCGRLGGALALALNACGYRLEGLVARRLSHAQAIQKLIGKNTLALSERQLNRLPASELILIATPDDVIGKVARTIALSQKQNGQGRTVLHTSGALSSEVLSALAGAGFQVGSLHPLVSISDPQTGAENLRTAFFCLEGDRSAVRLADALVRDLGGRSFSIAAADKALYHAAAVTASGHVVALIDIALEMLGRCGLSRSRARQVLLPLVKSTVDNLSANDPARALTGTFARGDVATVQRHLAAINEQHLTAALAAYTLLGRRSLSLAGKNKADESALNQIAGLLADVKGANE
jgi:predicted short-subunit dehydrogenase-like oxidoreductase (DUF2520 family)